MTKLTPITATLASLVAIVITTNARADEASAAANGVPEAADLSPPAPLLADRVAGS